MPRIASSLRRIIFFTLVLHGVALLSATVRAADPKVTFVVSAKNGSTCFIRYNVAADRWEVPPIVCSPSAFSNGCSVPGMSQALGFSTYGLGIGTQLNTFEVWAAYPAPMHPSSFSMKLSLCPVVRIVAIGQMNGYNKALGLDQKTGIVQLYDLTSGPSPSSFKWQVQSHAEQLQSTLAKVCKAARKFALLLAFGANDQSPTSIFCDGSLIKYHSLSAPTNITVEKNRFYLVDNTGFAPTAMLANGSVVRFFANDPREILNPPLPVEVNNAVLTASDLWLAVYDQSKRTLQIASFSGFWRYRSVIQPLPSDFTAIRTFVIPSD